MIPSRVVLFERFPALGSGKVDGHRLRELLASGEGTGTYANHRD
jgi:non-ribosomal peptide synthetase component E (peptide arylation enzyme)